MPNFEIEGSSLLYQQSHRDTHKAHHLKSVPQGYERPLYRSLPSFTGEWYSSVLYRSRPPVSTKTIGGPFVMSIDLILF